MKTSTTENRCNKVENSQPQAENKDYTENRVKFNKLKQNIIRELIKFIHSDMKINHLEKKMTKIA